jgi:molybdopterin-guanine dinucleotide biosynthesis protein B
MKAFAVVGYKNSGKSTLVCQLTSELKKRGYRVGTLKHDVHDFEIDREGTDTSKHRQAGADVVAIASQDKWAVQGWGSGLSSLDEMLRRIEGVDLVLVEGYKQSPLPKIVMVADRQGAIFQNEKLENVAACAAAEGIPLLAPPGVPVYDRNEIGLLAELILEKLALKQEER